ncbi:MAG: hypothetical protein PSX81_04915 [bacterium]|nr:hypothetical protein [bacterium]
MKPNKNNYDIQFNKFKNSPSVNDSDIPPFEEVVKAQKVWLVKSRLQMILRYSLSCIAIVTIALVGYNFMKSESPKNAIALTPNPIITKDTSVIKAPVKAWDIPYQVFKINADSLSIITMTSGTCLTISPNSLIDSAGQMVKGLVDINCREFFDPIDIMVAGIPMQYDSAGKSYNLETAGMIEINGSQNNQRLKIAEGKSIAIAQMSFGGNDYNTYSLDTKSGKWTYEGRPISQSKESLITTSIKTDRIKNASSVEQDKFGEVKSLNSPIFSAPKLQDESNPSFRLEVDKNTFPELAVYNNILFEVRPGQGFNSTNEEWDWIDLKQGNRPNEYKVFLHDGGKTITALVSPVFKEGEDYKAALSTFKKYEKAEFAKIDLNKKTEAESRRKLERAAEIAAKVEIAKMKYQIDENAVVREFRVGSFGYWNSDRPYQSVSPRSMKVRVELSEKNIQLINLFHIEKGTNTIFTNYHIEPNTFYIQYDAYKENTWFVILPNTQKIAVLFSAEFTSQLSSNIGILKMEVSEREFKNPKDLKNYLLSSQ